MTVEVDKLKSLELWRQKRPDLYAQARTHMGDPKHVCPVCEGRYPIIDVLFPGDRESVQVLCVCWCPAEEDHYRELVQAVNQLPARITATFDTLIRRGTAKEWATVERAWSELQDIALHPYQHRWLFMWGTAGCGKTHLLKAAQTLMPHVCAYTSADMLAVQIHDMLKDNSLTDLINGLADVPVLILDDLGADYENSEFVNNQLTNIINRRYMFGELRPTIVASNLGTATLNDRYPRLASRVLDKGLSERINIPLWDYRQHLKVRPTEPMKDETTQKPNAHGKVRRHNDTRDEKVVDSL